MNKLGMLLMMMVLAASCVAQSDPVAVPTPAPAPPLSGTLDGSDVTPTPRFEDNVRPLSGVQDFDLGSRTELFNLFTPSFNFSQSYGTNPGFSTGANNATVWGATSNVGGALKLMRSSATQKFALAYRGGAQISTYDSNLNTQMHTLGVTETVTSGRWNYVLGNDLSYEPNAFGQGPFTLPSMGDGSGLHSGLPASDSILTQQLPRLNDSAYAQATYGLSRVSAITANASYGTLHYFDGDLMDTRQFSTTGSYDHRFGHNTIGAGYTYSRFMYTNAAENFDTNAAEVTYGRRVVGRISADFAIGPTFTTIHLGPISFTDISASGRANIRYAGNKSNLSVGYRRAVTGGSGVLNGAVTDSISATIDRKLTHTLTGSLSTGYNRNTGITTHSVYDSLFFTGAVSRPVGRYMSVSIGYNGQRQTSSVQAGNLPSMQSIIASFQWNFRPIRLH